MIQVLFRHPKQCELHRDMNLSVKWDLFSNSFFSAEKLAIVRLVNGYLIDWNTKYLLTDMFETLQMPDSVFFVFEVWYLDRDDIIETEHSMGNFSHRSQKIFDLYVLNVNVYVSQDALDVSLLLHTNVGWLSCDGCTHTKKPLT